MKLFEIATSGFGYSYMRCYAWCNDELTARAAFEKHNPNAGPVSIQMLFDGVSSPFITSLDDEGFSHVFQEI